MTARRCAAWAVIALACSLAIAAAVEALGEPAFDMRLHERSAPLRDGAFGALLRTLSWIGYASRFVPLLGLVVAALVAWRRQGAALAVAASTLLGFASFAAIKQVLRRERPPLPEHVVGGFAMPSGHATTAFALAVALLLALPALRRWWSAALLLAYAALTAMSRVVLGVHYVTDVVAGALLGTACALAAWALVQGRGGAGPDRAIG